MLFQVCFGMPIRFIEEFRGIFELVKLTELMRHIREDKSHGTANRFFSSGENAFDRHHKLFEQCLDFFEESRQIALRTTEEGTSQQDFFGEAVTHHPEDLVADIGL
jgi:hypothetical protein